MYSRDPESLAETAIAIAVLLWYVQMKNSKASKAKQDTALLPGNPCTVQRMYATGRRSARTVPSAPTAQVPPLHGKMLTSSSVLRPARLEPLTPTRALNRVNVAS